MSWTEIVIETARNDAEALSDALLDAGALSVSVEDADLGTAAEQPLFGEPGLEPEQTAWERSRVIALVAADSDHRALVASAAAGCGLGPDLPYRMRTIAEQDWVRLTQSQFDPIHIGRNIWVVPSWHQAPDPGALVLELDPGLAFGTGSHPTTRLCMEWLEAHAPQGQAVLDYGCGSGILAIVAHKLGAARVAGVDIDPQAVESARHNSARNGCDIDYYLPHELTAASPTPVHPARFDLVVANILSGPLQLLAPMLCHYLAPGGRLLLSGILANQATQVAAAYAPFLQLTVQRELDGWVALAGQLAATPKG